VLKEQRFELQASFKIPHAFRIDRLFFLPFFPIFFLALALWCAGSCISCITATYLGDKRTQSSTHVNFLFERMLVGGLTVTAMQTLTYPSL